MAIAPQYEKATSFNDMGLAVAYDGQKAFLIDKKGQTVPGADSLDPSAYFSASEDFDQIIYSPGEYVVIERDGKYGFGHIEYLPELPEVTEMSAWAYNEVVTAIQENLVPTSMQNLYRNKITREEFCALTVRAIEETLDKGIADVVLERTGKSLTDWLHAYPFTDTSDSDVIAAYALGVVNGYGEGTFAPYTTITRQEAAAFLTRTAKVLGMDTAGAASAAFTDGSQVASYFTEAVNFVSANGIMNGMGNSAFAPLDSYTREQSYLTILRLFENVTK